MSADNVFFDTNVVLYLLSAEVKKANRAESLLSQGGVISVQVLNECAATTSRKLRMKWPEIHDILNTIRRICKVVPITLEVHEKGLRLAERHRFSLYDAMIVAAAILSGCKVLYSEDMQHGRTIEGVTIKNPFK